MRRRLLIADGDAALCEVYRKYFAARGYEVEVASSGLDCLGKLRRSTPAVLVLDRELRWGGSDGVLAWLREASAPPAIPVIVTAAAGLWPDGAEAAEPPVVNVLLKPFALTELLAAVGTAASPHGREEAVLVNGAGSCSELFIG